MAGSTSVGWQIIGTVCCGFVFAIPIMLGYLLVKAVMSGAEKRKEKLEKQQTVI
ncbi:MAG: hypothetical protein JXA54_15160 [Candidatus Heimdallarchaeota archaeon]|nr:hypothetical protein [Candidatus Heimdallarchaeota archaeon]